MSLSLRGAIFATFVCSLILAWACSQQATPRETECDNGFDDDSDQLTDCHDPDCSGFAVCYSGPRETQCDNGEDDDGDGLVDCDDGDCSAMDACEVEGDADADADSDGAVPTCPLECPQSGQSALQDVCQMGDCYESGERRQCCVSTEILCHTVITVGDVYEDLDVAWRGFYDDEHECKVRVIGDDFIFSAQTRGLACSYGFISVRVRGTTPNLELGTTYALCDDDRLGPTDLAVNVTVGGSGEEQTNYTNSGCPTGGTFTLTTMGSETGDSYAFELQGTLAELDEYGQPTDASINVAISSDGLVTVEEP